MPTGARLRRHPQRRPPGTPRPDKGRGQGARGSPPAHRAGRSRDRPRDPRLLLLRRRRGRGARPGRLEVGRRGLGQAPPVPHGGAPPRGVRPHRPARPAGPGQRRPARPRAGRRLAAHPARPGRGPGLGNARPARPRRLPGLDLGRVGETLAPRDRRPRTSPAPAHRSPPHLAAGSEGSGSAMTKHGFGIVGAGVIATTHAQAIAALPDAHLVAVTDVRPDAARAFADKYGCVAEPDLAALLARDDVEVVTVCVPSGLHAEVGVQAAAAGKHLVVEKPIDVTLAAADKLINAADAADVALTVISQHRFDAGLIELRRLLDDGALGDLVLGEAKTKWNRTQENYDTPAGGGP